MQEVAAKLHGIKDVYLRGNWRNSPLILAFSE
jgi:hypothetical protein